MMVKHFFILFIFFSCSIKQPSIALSANLTNFPTLFNYNQESLPLVELCYNDKGDVVKHGEQFIPLGIDTCTQCTCMNGKAEMCISVLCSPPQNCRKYHEVTNKCCEFLCLDGEIGGNNDNLIAMMANHHVDSSNSNAITKFFPNKTMQPKEEINTFNVFSTNNLGLRLITSTVTSFLILALLLFMIHRLRQRRLIIMIRRLQNRRLQQLNNNSSYNSNVDPEISNNLRAREMSYGNWPGFLPIHRPEPHFMHYGYVPFVEPPPPYQFLKITTDQYPQQLISSASSCMEQFLPPTLSLSSEAPPSYEESITNIDNVASINYRRNLTGTMRLPASQTNQPFRLVNQLPSSSYPGHPIATYRTNQTDNTNCPYLMNNISTRNNIASGYKFNPGEQQTLRKEVAVSQTSINNESMSMPMTTTVQALSKSLGEKHYILNRHKSLSSNDQSPIHQDYKTWRNNTNTNGNGNDNDSLTNTRTAIAICQIKTSEQTNESQQQITIVQMVNDMGHDNNQCFTSSHMYIEDYPNVIKKESPSSLKKTSNVGNKKRIIDNDGDIFGIALPSSSNRQTSMETMVEECQKKQIKTSLVNLPSSSICSKEKRPEQINQNHLLNTSTESSSASSSPSPDILSSSSSSSSSISFN